MTSRKFTYEKLEELDELYGEIMLDHYRNPRNCVLLPNADIRTEGGIPLCGDEVTIQITLDGEHHIQDIGFQGQGCSISQASASMMTAVIKGRTLEQVEVLAELVSGMFLGRALSPHDREKLEDLKALRGVRKFPMRIKCALLAWTAVREGINEHRARGAC